jgi:hypothetical protein
MTLEPVLPSTLPLSPLQALVARSDKKKKKIDSRKASAGGTGQQRMDGRPTTKADGSADHLAALNVR